MKDKCFTEFCCFLSSSKLYFYTEVFTLNLFVKCMGIVFHGSLNIWNVYYISGDSSLGWVISLALLYVESLSSSFICLLFLCWYFLCFICFKSIAHWSIFLITVLKSLWDTFYIWVISALASLDYLSSFRWEVYWFLVWLVISNCILDIVSIMLGDSGSYLNLRF